MSEHTVKFTDDNFEQEVLKAEGLVVVDFWATWCGPCKMIAPILEALAEDYQGKVKIGKLSTEENQKVPTDLGVQAIPTVILFKDGKEVDRVMGAAPKEAFIKLIKKGL